MFQTFREGEMFHDHKLQIVGAIVADTLAVLQFAMLGSLDRLQMLALYAFTLAIPSGIMSISLLSDFSIPRHQGIQIGDGSTVREGLADIAGWVCLAATAFGFGAIFWRFSNASGVVFALGIVAVRVVPGMVRLVQERRFPARS